MELTIRDWMIIVGAGLVLAVLVDAIRESTVIAKQRSDSTPK